MWIYLQVFISAALMEYYCSKVSQLIQIIELEVDIRQVMNVSCNLMFKHN